MMSNYELYKNYYIQASAGTGKTHNIIEIIKKVVEKVPLERILVVTYTEKAVEELRNRVRERVEGIDASLSEIYTIHSFCQKSIREFCVSANKPVNLDVISEKAVVSFVERFIRDEEIFKDILKIKNLNDDFKMDKLRDNFVSAIGNYYLNKDNREDERIIRMEKTDPLYVEAFVLTSYENLKDKHNDIYQIVEKLNQEGRSEKAKVLYQHIKDGFDPYGKQSVLYDDVKKGDLKNDKEAQDVYDYLMNIRKSMSGSYYTFLVSKYIDSLYAKWQEEKVSSQVQSFNDMIRTVREEIVSGGALKDAIRKKYDYAIIDEFQDTNGLQWDIFKNLFLDESHTLIVVGDKKQSIYSFQGADVSVYEKAISDIKAYGGEGKVLEYCFRSSESIIEATNRLFATNNFMGKDFTFSKYPVRSNPKEDKKALFDGTTFKPLWIVKNDDNLSDYEFARVASYEIVKCVEKKGNKTRLQISDGNGGYRNVTFRDFTVLSRTRPEALAIRKELQKISIPSVCYKDTSLFTGKECVHWMALLQAIYTPDFTGRNRKAFRRALYTDFFGYSLKDIRSDVFDRDDLKEIEMINKWRDVALSERYEDLIDSIIEDSNIEKRMSGLNDIQSLSIYKQIGDYAIEYLSENHNIEDLIRRLDELHNSNDESNENISIVGRSTNFDAVQIMTIHASKGLEFPVVIFASNYSNPSNSLGDWIKCHDDKNNPLLVSSGDKYKEKINIEISSEWKRLFYVALTRASYLMILPHYNKIIKEPYNFLYPILSEFMEKNKDYYEEIKVRDVISDKKASYDQEKEIVKEILKAEEIDSGNKENQDIILKELIRNKKNKLSYKHSYSSLSHGSLKESPLGLDAEDDKRIKEGEEIKDNISDFDKRGIIVSGKYDNTLVPLAFPSDYPKGALVGTALHEIFELLDFNNHSDEDINDLIIKAFNNQDLELKDEWKEVTIEMVNRVMNGVLPVIEGNKMKDTFFTLSTVEEKDKKAEVEFNFNFFGEHLRNYANGFIDLLFRRGDYYSILDWKSDTLNDEDLFNYGDVSDLENHTNNRYSIQRVLYSYCLIKWLKNFYPHNTEEEIFNNHFGGIYYVYIRGCDYHYTNGIYAKTWNSFQELEQSFKEILERKIGGR